jgi:hypothetical protein
MKYDLQLMFTLLLVGIMNRKLSWRGWFGISILVITWIMYNWLRY